MSRLIRPLALAAVFAAVGALGCQDAVSPAAALVVDEFGITDIAVDDFHLYFAKADGSLSRISLDGGPIETILSGLTHPRYLAVDSEGVFVATSTGTLVRAPKAGGDIVTLAEGENEIGGLGIDDTHVFFTVRAPEGMPNAPGGAVRRVAKADGTAETLASDQTNPGPIAVSLGHVYWANIGASDDDGEVLDLPVSGGTPFPLVTGLNKPNAIAADRTFTYWGNLGDGVIGRVNLDGTDARTVAPESTLVHRVAGDGQNVYWTNATGAVSVAPVDGGAEPFVISSGSPGAVSLALDATSVYWARYESGTVMVRAKP